MITKDQWLALFIEGKADTRKDQMLIVVKNLDGYGIEYGFDEYDDAESLIAAFDAFTEWWKDKA